MAERIDSFETFWPFYVREHSQPLTRKIHFVGTSLVFGFLLAALWTRHARWLWPVPLAGYGCAWLSHLIVERNWPATFRHPLYSLYADFVMYKKMCFGEMEQEVSRFTFRN